MRALLLLPALVLACCLWAQSGTGSGRDRVEILHADRWDFDEKLAPGAQRLSGAVRFRHASALMDCDSAYLFGNNDVHAFGRVRIRHHDTLTITGDRLHYDGALRQATISGAVVLTDPGMVLTTDRLTYDLRSRSAHYGTGATIQDRRDPRTISSNVGTYLAGQRRMEFSGNVHIVDPERTIRSDTLHYAVHTGSTEFFGPTTIVQGSTRMFGEQGRYETSTGEGRFTRKGVVLDRGLELRGDTLVHNATTGTGTAVGHVLVLDTANDLLVRGHRGAHDTRSGASHVTDAAELVLFAGGDSLYLHGDTLFATTLADGGRKVEARTGVRFFKDDLQGVCDTMVYTTSDSTVYLLGSPFVWSNADQINGDTVTILLASGKLRTLHADGHAMLVTRADTVHFDQVAGKRMVGRFMEGKLRRIEVEGNTRTIYFAQEEKEGGGKEIIGVNRADCSRLHVLLDTAGQVVDLTFLTRPDAVLHPLAKAPPEALHLEDFKWNAAERPMDRAGIFQGALRRKELP